MEPEKVYAMKISKVYPLLVAKAERKGRTREEVDTVTCWLTGYTEDALCEQIEQDVDYRTFFEQAPEMNPNRNLITGSICGIKVQEIQDPLMQNIRYLDKLVDELAKGKTMDKILRSADSSARSALWKCPKCGREFKKIEQSHYCGKKPETVDEYINTCDEAIRKQLTQVRDCMKNALADAEEKISWSMPTYWKGHNIIHFAAQKKHIGIYPGAEAVNHFSEELSKRGYKYSKGSIQIPYSDKLPLDLIEKITRWCDETGNHA